MASFLCRSTASAADGGPDGKIRLLPVEGTVQLMQAGAKTWALTTTNDLHPGDRIRTGEKSRVQVQFSDQSVVSFGPLAEFEILPPGQPGQLPGIEFFKGILSFFHRDKPGRIRVLSRGAIAGVTGTEFVMQVLEQAGRERVVVSVIDGQVDLGNAQGSVSLTNLQQGIAETGQAPTRATGFVVNHLLQWCFHYPAVLNPGDLPLPEEARQVLGPSLAAYGQGDVLAALAAYPGGREPGGDAERIYLAALLLAVGDVAGTEARLATLVDRDTGSRIGRLAGGLRLLVSAVRRDQVEVPTGDRLPTEWLAASYYSQGQATGDASLGKALAEARRAAELAPDFAFAWARVAELEFSHGRTRAAVAAADRALGLAPRAPQALALRGFLAAADNRFRQALDWFDRALAVDPFLGNARLGRGLSRIRSGDWKAGRDDLLVAAAQEPQRAVLRSYLGKAWSVSGEDDLARREFALAQGLDPGDPTSWLYAALNHQDRNRLNEAIADLEKAQSLNINRQVYRSSLLLDQDRAVRGASLASIYRENGMADVSLREAARAVVEDYTSHSAHQFLANSHDALRDPTRFNLREETVWFNELLLANLLAPAGVRALSPNISQQEYGRFFESGRPGLTTTTEYRSDGQVREIASQFGSVGRVSWSLDLDYQHNDGVRDNNDLDRLEWYSQLKFELSPRDSLILMTKYQDYSSGDNFQYYDPKAVVVSTNPLTGAVSSQPVYRPHYRYDEEQKPIVVGAYHREWAPGIRTLALAGRLVNDQHVSDRAVNLPVLSYNNGQLASVSSSDFDVRYRNELEIYTGELQQVFQTSRSTLLLGGRVQAGQFTTDNSLSNLYFPAFFPSNYATVDEDLWRWSAYAYETFEVLPSRLWLTAGLSYDVVEYPENYRQVPVSSGQARDSRWGPKAAAVWSPAPSTTVRAAYTRSLGGVSLEESYRLEPSQLAGFIQSYRTIIPESVVGSVAAPTFDTFGVALDLQPASRTYVGLVAEMLSSDVDRELGAYGYPDSSGRAYGSSMTQSLDYDEYAAGLVVNQLLSRAWSLGAAYRWTRAQLDQSLPDVPLATYPGGRSSQTSDLHTVRLHALFNHPSGFFARVEADYYAQQNLQDTYDTAGIATTRSLPDDSFWQVNLWAGWRLRQARGDLAIGVLNVADQDYHLNPLNLHAELPRERVLAARLRLRF